MPAIRDTSRNVGDKLTVFEWSRVGIVVGLAAEARLVEALGAQIAVGGGTSEGARSAAARLGASGVNALISVGLAGGLDPSLPAGCVLVPESVLHGGRSFAADRTLCRMLGGSTPHRLLDAGRVIAGVAEKQMLWQRTGCAAVDLESGVVAQLAEELELPFGVLRVICDPARRGLPPASLVALDSDGHVSVAAVLRSIARHPLQVGGLLALAADAARARRGLRDYLQRITTEPVEAQ